jgi:hypothetical protein
VVVSAGAQAASASASASEPVLWSIVFIPVEV